MAQLLAVVPIANYPFMLFSPPMSRIRTTSFPQTSSQIHVVITVILLFQKKPGLSFVLVLVL